MDYDVFISYRRDGGDSFAMILKNELKDRGLKVFHDIESLRSGDFNKQLYTEIEKSRKFVLVLPPNALDRCVNENDWVRLEIEHAIKSGKDIIPIMMRGFVFPENLPAPLDRIANYQGLEPRMDHTFDASMDYLVSLINDNNNETLLADVTFDIRQVRTFASCGNESTVFKIKKSADGQSVKLIVNFEKTRLRDEIPEYAGAYYLKHPAVDVSKAKHIRFSARSEDESIETVWLEVKPEGKAWMHESFDFCVSSDYEEFIIPLADFAYPDTKKCVEEITFVIKPVSFTNEELLKGSLEIRDLVIQ